MDEKLAKYRKEKAKQKFKNELKDKCKRLGSRLYEAGDNLLKKIFREGMPDDDHQVVEVEEDAESIPEDEQSCDYLLYLTILITWASLYVFFIYIEFGAVYFCVTGLLFVYFNTRTGKKLRNEMSAYSVFNRNCETIDGTFTAEQFDKQIRSGML